MKRLFLDVETSQNLGYFWRPGNKIRVSVENIVEEKQIICASWKWQGQKRVHNAAWRPVPKEHSFKIGKTVYKGYKLTFCDRQVLIPVIKAMDLADEIVMQNGDRFDVPWIKARALFHNLPMKPTYRTFDTLKKSRAHFYLNSHRLDYRRKYCGGRGKDETEYGMWYRIQTENHGPTLRRMMKYCDNDVRELEDDFNRILPYVPHNTHAGVLVGRPKWTCGVCGTHDVRHSKEYATKAGTIRHGMKCRPSGHGFTISDTEYRRWIKER